ncbi:hypothetical protein GCM10028784_20430 [Myceligenerans cantabricum]
MLPDESSHYASGLWRTDATLLDDLYAAARRDPGAVAYLLDSSDGTTTLTFGQVADRVEVMAANLARLGIRAGDVVTVQLPNCWQLMALCFACYRIGAVPAPVVTIMREREVGYMMELTGSRIYIGPASHGGRSYSALSRAVAAGVPSVELRLHLENDDPDALDLDAELLAPARLLPESWPAATPDSPAQIAFTSGTTGEPKGVVHTHNTMHAINLAQIRALGLDGSHVFAMGAPTAHQAGFTWNFIMPLLLGAPSVHVPRWDPDRMLELIEAHGVTFFMGAPTFLSDLITAQRRTPRDLRSLRMFATGSAPVPPVLVEQAEEALGARVYSLWGMTENGCVTVTRPEHDPLRSSRSDGVVVDGMEVAVFDRETGRLAAPGEPGVLKVRGASQCRGYYGRDEHYGSLVDPDGWFDTGDLARDDGEGGIRIAGRTKDIITRGAENIPVVEVEGLLLRHPDVHDVAVVGYPDDRLGERACAVIQGRESLTLHDLQRHLDSLRMAKHYWPERIHLVDHLPRTPSGKVRKFELREQLQES